MIILGDIDVELFISHTIVQLIFFSGTNILSVEANKSDSVNGII